MIQYLKKKYFFKFKENDDVEIKDIFISAPVLEPSQELFQAKRKSINEDIFLRDTCIKDDNRTALFLAKINAHITNNLNKSMNLFGKFVYSLVSNSIHVVQTCGHLFFP